VTAPLTPEPPLDVAEAAAAPALAELHAACFPPPSGWGSDAIALMLGLPGAFGLWRPGEGFVLARAAGGEAEILTLAVVPGARRRGLGATLVSAAMVAAVTHGAEAMFLEVAEGNRPALRLYRRLGFAEVGRRRRYYPDGADALVLRRDLR
jgi:ribosomal-protein-alanine N-acetyltransferase